VADLQAWGPARASGNVAGHLWSKQAYSAVAAASATVDQPAFDTRSAPRTHRGTGQRGLCRRHRPWRPTRAVRRVAGRSVRARRAARAHPRGAAGVLRVAADPAEEQDWDLAGSGGAASTDRGSREVLRLAAEHNLSWVDRRGADDR
jgi:hypothetical protein